MKRLALLAISALLMATPAVAQQVVLTCWATGNVGFFFNGIRWAEQNFQISGLFYQLTRQSDGKYTWGKIGSTPTAWCNAGPNETGFVFCDGFETVKVNVFTKRFMVMYSFGFIDGVDANENNPSIKIGECSD